MIFGVSQLVFINIVCLSIADITNWNTKAIAQQKHIQVILKECLFCLSNYVLTKIQQHINGQNHVENLHEIDRRAKVCARAQTYFPLRSFNMPRQRRPLLEGLLLEGTPYLISYTFLTTTFYYKNIYICQNHNIIIIVIHNIQIITLIYIFAQWKITFYTVKYKW